MAILKLYQTNRTTQPDLAISSGHNEKFSLIGSDVATLPKKTTSWPYARLELFSDEGADPTFVVPTIIGDNKGYLEVEGGQNATAINFKCHMVLLNGAGTGESSTVGLFMKLYRSPVDSKWTTYLWAWDQDPDASGKSPDTNDGGIGDTGWTWFTEPHKPIGMKIGDARWFNFPLAQINADWFHKRLPHENIDGNSSPGALLQNAFPNGRCPSESSLQIQYVPAAIGQPGMPVPATLAFVFRPGNDSTEPFPLPVDRTGNRFTLPVLPRNSPPVTGMYRLVQRPSDAWLTGTLTTSPTTRQVDQLHQEWLVTLDSGDLQTFWNQAVVKYNEALRTARSVNRVTLLPLVVSATVDTASPLDIAGESFSLRAEFHVRFRENPGDQVDGDPMNSPVMIGDLKIQSFRVKPFGTLTAMLQFFLNVRNRVPETGDRGMENLSVFYNTTLQAIDQTQGLDSSFGFEAVLGKQTAPTGVRQLNQQVRIGSLDLTFGGDTATIPKDIGSLQVFQIIDLSMTWATMPRMFSKMKLPLLLVTPGGQDGLPASEYAPENASVSLSVPEQCMEGRFNGSAPVVIPVPPKDAPVLKDPQFVLEASESNQDAYSQTVALTLRALSGKGTSAKPRVIVVDSDPFLVAAVDYPQLSGSGTSNVVALWNTGGVEGAVWQLQVSAQPFTLMLPPQGIGEEMPKDANGILSTPLKFRLSPPAVQTLQASYTPQNFAEAPWNLRRILGYPGQRDAGAGVVQLNFELLYGLACTVDTPLLRLAEIFALVGRIPGRMPPLMVTDPKFPATAAKTINVNYERKRWDWSLFAALYSKRVALLEPRASGDNYGSTTGASGASAAPEVFTLSQGVSCTFRGAADLYYSVDPRDIAAVDDETFPGQKQVTGLKGGVSWPFESPRIFHATVRNPKSSSAVASGLALSPLGGTGTIKAGFDKDLSTITSITEVGRSSKVSVARLGRIGVFHNLARYVIEYERDTSVSNQFQDQPKAFDRLPVLRKVREFVEILEPIATLSTSSQAYPGAGCVRSIEFKQRIIPVSAAWSSNVGDTGWKIPLWYEPASRQPHPPPPRQTYLYTLPEVVFNFAGAESADIECAILSVDKLCFYTETDAAADPDPHNWPIVSGVDFLPVPVPMANPTAFSSGQPHEIPAYDPATPFGLSSFTHQLDKGHGRVNVVNGRSNQAIGANLASVTLQRAPAQVSSLQTQLQILHDKVRGGVTAAGNLYDAVRQSPSNVFNLADDICAQAKNLEAGLQAQIKDLASKAVAKEQLLLQNWFQQFQQEIYKATDEVYAYLRQNTQVIGKSIALAKADITIAVDNKVDTFGNRLTGLTATANSLAQFFQRINETLTKANKDLDQKKTEITTALKAAQGRTIGAGTSVEQYVALVKTDVSSPIDRCNALLTQVRTQVLARAEVWMPAASLVCHAWERNINGSLMTTQAVLAQADILLSYANSGADDQVSSAENAVTSVIGKAINDVNALAFPPNLLTDCQAAAAGSNALQNLLDSLPGKVKSNLDGYIDAAAKQTNLQVISGASDLQSLTSGIAQQIIAEANTSVIVPAQTAIDSNATTCVGLLQKYATDASGEVCDATAKLQAAAINQMEAYRRPLEDALGRFAESVSQALPSLDIKMPPGVSLPVLLNRAFGEVPAIPNLGFSLPNAAYFYLPSLPNVPLTPLLTKVKDLVPNLSPLSTMLPSFALSDRALPVPNLPSFDLNGIFPDFAGLKLSNLFPALKMPVGSNDAVKVTHGVDTGSRTAWIQADIDLKTDTAVIFSIGPMALQIVTPRFTSTVRAQAGANGQVSKQATGAITGDWQLMIGGSPMITLRSTGLTFDKDGKLHVDVSPDRVELSAALAFIQEIIAEYTSPDSGFGIYPSATGIETRLSLPIPNTSVGTTGITNLTFNFLFGLSWLHDFELYAGFGLASPNAPFNLSVFILGGGGHLVATAYYHPGGSLTCQVDMALDASAALAIALGPISGSVHINLGMRFIFNSGGGDLSLGIFLLIGGEVSILSVVSAQVMLKLEATYSGGVFTCRGIFSISIKICWCFTLNVSEEVHCSLGSGGGLAYAEDPLGTLWNSKAEAPLLIDSGAVSTIPAASILNGFPNLAVLYVNLVD